MNQISLNEDFVKKYLLGDIDEVSRRRLEERLLTDEDFFEDFAALEDRLEDELIDEYVGGEMSERASAGFENVFLVAPHRVEKFRLVRGLHDYVNAPDPVPDAAGVGRDAASDERAGLGAGRPAAVQGSAGAADAAAAPRAEGMSPQWWPLPLFLGPRASLALTLALLCTMIGTAVFYARSRRLETELRALRQGPPEQGVLDELARLRARNEELTADLRRAESERDTGAEPTPTARPERETVARAPQPQPARVYTLALSLARSRAADGQTIPEQELPANATGLKLLLKLEGIDPADYKGFSVAVSKRDGTPVKSNAVSRPVSAGGDLHLTTTLPAGQLTAGDYLIRLNGRQADGTESLIGVYDFRLIRR